MNDTIKEHIRYIFSTDIDKLNPNILSQNKGLSALCLLYKGTISRKELIQKFADSVQLNNISTASVPDIISEISKYIDVRFLPAKLDSSNPPAQINVLEDFLLWFIELDGIKNNYFTHTFSANKEKLKQELINYQRLFESEFNINLFLIEPENIVDFIDVVQALLEKNEGPFFDFSAKKSNHMPRAILGKKNYLSFLSAKFGANASPLELNLAFTSFFNDCAQCGLLFSSQTVLRFIASLLTKPFVILTGLSGSGKTKLAQAFVYWICQNKSQYCIVPVGADWTNREPLLGYPNALKPEEYVKPDNGVLDLIFNAIKTPDQPHFLILDEMNLSHVERYFADFLSAMESQEEISLHANLPVQNGVPSRLKLPPNLFIIGTVNIDETTNMFSPKVLDRANTIEFRVAREEMANFLNHIKDIKMESLEKKGASMAKSFMDFARNKSFSNPDNESINSTLILFFGELKKSGAEFGYRSATEMLRLIHQLSVLDSDLKPNQKLDIAIMQKLLPKLHGSRRKLCPVLETLGSFCLSADLKIIKDVFDQPDFNFDSPDVKYPLSLEKISRMYRGAIDNGFASFAEH